MFIKVNGVFPQDPANLIREFSRLGWDSSVWRNKANAFHYLRGTSPSVGYFLLMFDDLTDTKNTPPLKEISLEINTVYTVPGEKKKSQSQSQSQTDTITIEGLEIAEAEVIHPIENPSKGIYLAKIIDPIVNKWSYTYVDKDFNVPTGFEGGKTVYDKNTLKAGATPSADPEPYTWQELFDEVSGNTISVSQASFPKDASNVEIKPEGLKFKLNSKNVKMSRKEALDWLLLITGHTILRKPDKTLELIRIDSSGTEEILSEFRSQFLRRDSHVSKLRETVKIPERIKFRFRKVEPTTNEDTGLEEIYTDKERDIDTEDPTTSTLPFVPELVWSVEAPLYDNTANDAELEKVADHLIAIYRIAIKGLYCELQELELNTYINLKPSKGISEIIWYFTGDGGLPRTHISSFPREIEFRPQRETPKVGTSGTVTKIEYGRVVKKVPRPATIDDPVQPDPPPIPPVQIPNPELWKNDLPEWVVNADDEPTITPGAPSPGPAWVFADAGLVFAEVGKPIIFGEVSVVVYEQVPLPTKADLGLLPEDPFPSWWPPPWPVRYQEKMQLDPNSLPDPNMPFPRTIPDPDNAGNQIANVAKFATKYWTNPNLVPLIENMWVTAIDKEIISASPTTFRKEQTQAP